MAADRVSPAAIAAYQEYCLDVYVTSLPVALEQLRQSLITAH